MVKKNEFIKTVAAKASMTQTDTDKVVAAICDTILEVIAQEDSVKLGNLCTFKGVTTPARTAHNPRTGEVVNVPEKHGQPRCKFSKLSKE